MDSLLPKVAKFIRHHVHDVRNDLTGIELEAVLLASMCPDEEVEVVVSRVRTQIRGVASRLQRLAARFMDPTPVRSPQAARDLFRTLEKQAEPGRPEMSWSESLGEAQVNVDAVSLMGVFRELLANAVKFGDGSQVVLSAAAEEGGEVLFSLREPKAKPLNPEAWGREPFAAAKGGNYGLGLWEADRIVRANGGAVSRVCENGQLITTITFPVE